MNLVELLQEPYGDINVSLFNIGIVLGLIPEDTEFSSKGKELIYCRSTLTTLLYDVYKLLVKSKAFYKDYNGTLKSSSLDDLYIVDLDQINTDEEYEWLDKQPFFHKDDLFADEEGNLFVCIESINDDKIIRKNVTVSPLI